MRRRLKEISSFNSQAMHMNMWAGTVHSDIEHSNEDDSDDETESFIMINRKHALKYDTCHE